MRPSGLPSSPIWSDQGLRESTGWVPVLASRSVDVSRVDACLPWVESP